ncbi:glycosyltransferase [Halomarina litorea]|uniref:glycosyltransferase n=1 Tax=Halomarina litorea TaxID=2961595 RepID=UPI0020C2C4A0|nr:glycosyltransferase [Halomarina sp. BCD28]
MTAQLTGAPARTDERQTTDTLFVSVIVPVYNDPEGVRVTLESLTEQTYGNYEIIVVDNRSTDDTRDVAAEFADRFDTVTVLDERREQSSYAARVRGIRYASGDVFAFIDADMTVERNWLDAAIERMDDDGLDYMACNVQLYTPGEESLVGKYNRLNGFPIDRYISTFHFAPTCCLFVRREVIETVGPFDTRFVSSGDREFGHRVHAAGFDLGYAEDVPMYHPTRTTLSALVKKAVRIGRGKQQLRQYYPERYGNPALIVFYPGLYSPTPPGRLGDVFRGWDRLDTSEKVAFYFLTYGLKLTNAYGTVRETVERFLGLD